MERPRNRNPFDFGRAVSGVDLADRQAEVAEVAAALTGGSKLFLIGPRRYGKTSILATAEEAIRRDKGVVLHYDLQSFVSPDAFLAALVSDAGRALAGGVEQFGKKLLAFFGGLRPEVTYDPKDGTFAATLGSRVTSPESRAPLFVEVFNGLEAMAKDGKRPVGVILDEFQEILALGGAEIEGALRAAVQRHQAVGYVFAGSQTRLLSDMTGDAGRPFYRLGARRFLGPVPRPDFMAFLDSRLRSTGFSADPDALLLVLDLAEDVPYNVQALAHTSWELLRESGGKRLNAAMVERAAEIISRRDDPFYTTVWSDLTSAQKAMLVALIHLRGRTLLGMEARGLHQLAAPTAQAALEGLEKKQVARREESGGDTVWRLEDPFLGVWLRKVLGVAGA